MFGEDASESPRQPSPWGGSHTHSSTHTPCRIPTPSSSLSHSQPLSHASLTSSSSSLLEEVEGEIFSGDVSSSGGSDDEAEEARDELGASSFASSGAGSRSALAAAGKGGRPRRLSAEDDDRGHIEYKLKLAAATPDRFNRLVTQLKWRLLQGGGEAMYEIGVLDDGTLVGLSRQDLLASLRTLERMADELGATVVVLKEIRLAHDETTGDAGDDGGKRRKWEKWKALVDASREAAASSPPPPEKKKDSTATTSASPSGSSATPVLGPSRSPTANVSFGAMTSPIADLPSVVSGTTTELFFVPKAQDKSSRKKKRYASILDDPPTSSPPVRAHSCPIGVGADGHPIPAKPKVRRNRPPKIVAGEDDEDDGGMFSVFDLDLNAPDSPLPTSLPSQPKAQPQPPSRPTPNIRAGLTLSAKSLKKKAHEEEKLARRKLKRALKDEESMRSLWGGPDDETGWTGQSLDPWGDDAPPAGAVDAEVEPLSLGDQEEEAGILATSPTHTIIPPLPLTPSSPTLQSEEATTPSQPSPLLLPTYRPATSLLSTTPRAEHAPGEIGGQAEEVEDGTERICVEALVVRKEMEGYLNFEDVGKWMDGRAGT